MVGGVGQRMLSSVSKRMAGEFFGNVGQAISAPPAVARGRAAAEAVAGSPRRRRRSSPRPPKAGGISSQDDFLKGIAVGAGLVLLGVVVGVDLRAAAVTLRLESRVPGDLHFTGVCQQCRTRQGTGVTA